MVIKGLHLYGEIYRNGPNYMKMYRLCMLVSLKTLGRLLTCPKSSGCWGGGFSILFYFSKLAKRGGGGYPQALPEVVTLRGC